MSFMNIDVPVSCNFTSVALSYAGRGWHVHPLVSRDKTPLTKHGLLDATIDPNQIRAWGRQHPDANIGIRTGNVSGFLAVDVDPEKGGSESLPGLPPLPKTLTSLTGGGGCHLLFRMPPGVDVRNSESKIARGIDIRANGGYIVAPGSIHESGNSYNWVDPEASLAELPEIWLPLLTMKTKAVPRGSSGSEEIPEGRRNAMMCSIAGKLRRQGFGAEAIFALLQIENSGRCNPPLNETELRAIADGMLRYEPTKVYAATEFGLTERVLDALDGTAAWSTTKGDLIYDGRVWMIDNYHKVKQRIIGVIKDLKVDADILAEDDPRKPRATKYATQVQTSRTVASVYSLLQHKIAKSPTDFDRDPALLNLANGTIDLRAVQFHEHSKDDFITKIVPAEYHLHGECPAFLRFLNEIMGGDVNMIRYLQRVFGSALLGAPRQDFVIFYGSGGNGKSTLTSIIQQVLGDYALTVNANIIMKQKHEGHPTEFAQLDGVRLVIAAETDDDHKLNASKIKSILGGEPISARRMREDFYNFVPQFLLVLSTNFKPVFDGGDFGLTRRLQIVPFVFKIKSEDRSLPTRIFQTEKNGILTWLVEGYKMYLDEGLNPPSVVKDATAEYVATMDTLGMFLHDRVILDHRGKVSVSDLYTSYVSWCLADAYVSPMTRLAFDRKVMRVYEHEPSVEKGKSSIRVWRGIKLKDKGAFREESGGFLKAV